MTVYVGAEHWRRGIGRALYTSLFTMLRRQGYVKAYAGITLPNPASVGVHEAVGFRPIAVYPQVGYKLGQWRDVGWWALELKPAAANPPEPIPIATIQESSEIAAALAEGQRILTD